LPFTGLAPLWATGNTTPIMLSAALIALFLVNAVIGDSGTEAATARPLRWGGMALGLALLPLVLIAAWSTGLRIGQYGLSVERLWALAFIAMATVTAIAYAAGIARPGDWPARLYRSNLHLAFILGGIAFILSTSLVSFDRIATADQVARLASGRIKPIDFDYRGLWFDFGPPGRAAIKRLAKESKDAQVRRFAAAAQKIASRWDDAPNDVARRSGAELDGRLTILPGPVPLEPGLRKRLAEYGACGPKGACLVRYVPGDDFAIAIRLPDAACKGCEPEPNLLHRGAKGDWGSTEELVFRVGQTRENGTLSVKSGARIAAIRAGKVEMRTVRRRQLYIDGKPFGEPIPLENAAEP
jgi:hypothetical protein